MRRELGVHNARRLHADLAFERNAGYAQIANDAASEGLPITDDEADELVISDVIFSAWTRPASRCRCCWRYH